MDAEQLEKNKELFELGVRFVAMNDAGVAFLRGVIAMTGMFRSSFSDDAYQTAFNEGKRQVGLEILGHLQRLCPQHVNKILIK